MAQTFTLEVSEVGLVHTTILVSTCWSVVLQVQGTLVHHRGPPCLLFPAGRLHLSFLSLLRPEEMPGVRESRGPWLHPGHCQSWLELFPYNDTHYQATIRGPGLVFILPFLEKAEIIDIRTKVFEVPSQQILTTDSVTLTVDAVVYYRVFDPVKAAIGAMDYNEVNHTVKTTLTNKIQAVRGLASSTLGGILGTYQLGNLLSERCRNIYLRISGVSPTIRPLTRQRRWFTVTTKTDLNSGLT